MRPAALAFAAAALCAAPAARAGEAPCWYENGVLVVTASVGEVTGDFILDTASPRTLLAETQAQTAGYEAATVTGDIRLAGLTLKGRTVEVADLDVRTGLFPTPIAGILGADLLAGGVLDVSFAPCRIGLHRAGRAPPLGASRTLPMRRAGELWAVTAAVSDGVQARRVRLVPATGSDAPLRLREPAASAPAREQAQELYPYGVRRPRLRAVSMGGELWEDVPSGLLKADASSADGWLGAPVLDRFRLRFDYARGLLHVAPAQRKGPGANRGPDRSRLRAP